MYGRKAANASTQSLDSLVELKDCTYFRDVVLLDLRLSYSFILVQNGIVYGVDGLTRGERGSG